jgi:uncharacterized membrane protein YhaH (DUF805 family)
MIPARSFSSDRTIIPWTLGIALCFLIGTLAVSHFVIKEPFSLDTNYCQYAQGVLFSRGVIHGEGASFQGLSVHINCMIDPFRSGYASKYPPGYSALIAAMIPLRAVPLINPLCGALTLFFTLLIVHNRYRDRATPFWTAVLAFVSVYFLHMSAESWNHPAALLACTLIVWAAFREEAKASSSSVIITLALIFCLMTRPFSAIGMGVLLVLIAIQRSRHPSVDGISPRRLATTTAVGMTAGFLAFGIYNEALTGSFFTSGYEALHGAPHNPGFHVDPYGRYFTPWTAFLDLGRRLHSLNEWLFMWPLPSLTLIGMWALSWRRWRSFDEACVAWIVTQSLVYCFMWSAGQVQFGPRFLYEAMPAFLILSARGAVAIEEALGGSLRVRLALLSCVGALSIVGFYRYLSWVALAYY